MNTADRPETSIESVVDDMVANGAQLIFRHVGRHEGAHELAAAKHPDVPMIWSSGDSAWADGKALRRLTNLGNIMGQMEYAKMIAGRAAALTTGTGSIAYLGPLINDETRRLVNSAFLLGASYCWENYRGEAAGTLGFEVKWIGFRFNIPGFTLDPTQVTNEFLAAGADYKPSGIDTTEAIADRTSRRRW